MKEKNFVVILEEVSKRITLGSSLPETHSYYYTVNNGIQDKNTYNVVNAAPGSLALFSRRDALRVLAESKKKYKDNSYWYYKAYIQIV